MSGAPLAHPQEGGLFPQAPDVGSLELGTVGWEDVAEHTDLGTADNDGYTLVRVQLYSGRDLTKPKKTGVAQGHRVLCQIGGGLFRVPPKGTRVLVAFPAGMRTTQGAAVIVCTIEKSPAIQFGAGTGSPDRPVMDFGNVDVVIAARSVTLQSKASPFPQYLSVGQPRGGGATPGIRMYDETGSGIVISGGKIMVAVTDNGSPPKVTKYLSMSHADGIDVMNTDGGGILCSLALKNSGDCWIAGANARLYTAGVYLGVSITNVLTNRALYGTPASPTPSATVLIGS